MSIGNMLLNGIYGSPLSRLTGGPQALPGNQQGQGSQGQPVGPQAAPVASGTPSAAPSSPQDLVQLYAALTQRQQAAQGIDQGLRMMAAANSTPTMARALMSQQSAPGMDIGTLTQLQAMQRQMQGYNQMAAGIPDLARISGLSPEMLQGMLMSNPDAFMKVVETYGGVGGGTSQDYMRALGMARANSPPGTTNQEIFKTHPWLVNQTTFDTTMKNAAEAKSNAMDSYDTLKQSANQAKMYMDQLADPTNHDALMYAIQNPGLSSANVAKWAGSVPASLRPTATSNPVAQMRNALDFMKSFLQTEKFAGTKNVRSTQEFNNLGASATNLDKATNDDDAVIREVGRLQDNAWTTDANLDAEAGHAVDASEQGLANRNYFNPEHPLYNGATEGQLKPAPNSWITKAKEEIAADPRVKHALQMQFRQAGYDPSGL